MLRSLKIQNYALIDTLEINFNRGFSVITGETGAGKSIILGAINLLLGQRATTKAVKNGTTKCIVEALFNLNNEETHNFFLNNDLEYDDECIVRREITATGKSRAFINDTPVTLTQLKELGELNVDIHSQHQNLLLNKEDFQLKCIDILAANKQELQLYANLFIKYKKAVENLQQAEIEIQKNREEQDYIKFQFQQLKDADLRHDELNFLENEENILRNAENIKESLYQAASFLENEQNGATNALKEAWRQMNIAGKNYAPAAQLAARIDSCLIELNDVTRETDTLADKIECNPQRLEDVTNRLNTIYSLLQKHHTDSIEKLLTIQADYQKKLDDISHSEDHLKELTDECDKALHSLLQQANKLTKSRRESAKQVEERMQQTLKELGMQHARFEVEIKQKEKPDRSGIDKINFLFSANRNVALQPIAQTASGGEIARVMLALKSLIASSENMPTIIFDEIDTGVSGGTAQKMAEIMRRMSAENKQVICITHLPQIAAMADAHYKVYKTDNEMTTTTHIIQLDKQQHTEEIARLLSGDVLTEAAMNNAKELIQQSSTKKI